MIDNSSYPTPEITANAHAFRELGLGYANLGALLMTLGLPYDSDAGRAYAGAITALMSGSGLFAIGRNAAATGTFAGYEVNRQPMLRVLNKHRSQAYKISPSHVPLDLLTAAREAWDSNLRRSGKTRRQEFADFCVGAHRHHRLHDGLRHHSVEPDIALIKYKKLVGGGMLKMVNDTVPRALRALGYDVKQIQEIVEYIEEHDTIEGAPHLKDDDLAVFDCAFKAGQRQPDDSLHGPRAK